MQRLRRSELTGIWAAVLLPVREDNEIDLDRLSREVEILVRSPVDGIYTHGTAGEFHAVGNAEFAEVASLVAAHATAAGKPFQIGASNMSADITLERIALTRNLEPAAFQVILPDWCVMSPGEVNDAISGFAAAADPVPLVLYNPPHAKRVLEARELARLSDEIPGLVGCKVAGQSGEWFETLRSVDDPISVFVPGHELASGRALGARGSYANVACLSPLGAARWWRMMADEPGRANDLEGRIQDFLVKHILPLRSEGYSDAALDKVLAALGGWADVGTRTRWPYRGVDELRIAALRSAASASIPEMLVGAGDPEA